MTWDDWLLAALALASFALFLAIIAWFVRETDLIIVLGVVMVLAAYDFFVYGPAQGRRARDAETARELR
jgi:CHASE2 domain-containing sensor protein